MPEWTPTDTDMRDIYALGNPFRDPAALAAEFDRWLADHDAEVRAPLEAEVARQQSMRTDDELTIHDLEAKVRAAWDDGHDAGIHDILRGADIDEVPFTSNPYRAALSDPTPEATS